MQTLLEPFVVQIFFLLSCLTAAGSAMVVSALKCSLFGGFASGKEDKTSIEGVQLLCLADFY